MESRILNNRSNSLYDLQVDWSGGSETMEEVLARIHQREEAAVKRERAMAYAFNHQVQLGAVGNIKFMDLRQFFLQFQFCF